MNLSERKRQNIDINVLDDLMLATEVKIIQRNGIRFLNCDYFDERLYGFKSKVLIKYSLFDLTSIKVYSLKGEYLCTAERVTETHPMAKILGTVTDFEDYKQKIVKQRKLKKKTNRIYKASFKLDILPVLKKNNIADFNQKDIVTIYNAFLKRDFKPRRLKNTMALLKQFLQYCKSEGLIESYTNFHVKRITQKNEFSLERITFED